MLRIFPTNKIPHILVVGVQTSSPQTIMISAQDDKKPHTFYGHRRAQVNGYREFEIIFPQAPATSVLSIYNPAVGNFQGSEDGSFIVTKIQAKPLQVTPIWLSNEDQSFIKFAQRFSENASVYTSGDKIPHIYRSDDAKFTIDYYSIIRDRKTGGFVSTPARIGHATGVIEVSKKAFMQFSVPMRMIVLLHEYCHKWKNPKNGLPIEYETGADISALQIYLSLGYSPLEAEYAFAKVFKVADTEQNRKRMAIIHDYIKKFMNGELGQYYSNGQQPQKQAA